MNRILLLNALVLALLFSVGCSGKVSVTGTVKFPDGEPLKRGSVFFRNEAKTLMYQGTLQQDGSFALGEIMDGDGIPPGTYAAWIAGANLMDYQRDKRGNPSGPRTYSILINTKYESPNTAGLTYTVSGGTNVIDITVEKP